MTAWKIKGKLWKLAAQLFQMWEQQCFFYCKTGQVCCWKNLYPFPWTGHYHFHHIDCPFNDYFNNFLCCYRWSILQEWAEAQEVLQQKMKGAWKWPERLADALKRLVGKAIEALPAIAGIAVGAILSFHGKAVGFVAEHTWALIVFVAGLIGWWLMQKVKKG